MSLTWFISAGSSGLHKATEHLLDGVGLHLCVESLVCLAYQYVYILLSLRKGRRGGGRADQIRSEKRFSDTKPQREW